MPKVKIETRGNITNMKMGNGRAYLAQHIGSGGMRIIIKFEEKCLYVCDDNTFGQDSSDEYARSAHTILKDITDELEITYVEK